MTLTTQTIVRYISPEGIQVPLSGGLIAGKDGIWLGEDPQGLAHVEVKAIFDAAARLWGEDYMGETIDHAELELPLFVFGADTDEIRRRKEWFKSLCPRDEIGWLACYTNMTGWRWVATRMGSFKPAIKKDPNLTSGQAMDLVLLVERPMSQEAPSTDRYKDLLGQRFANIYLNPGPDKYGWPSFAFRGPGQLTIRYEGQAIRFPHVWGNEEILIRTDEAKPTVRSSLGRNLWPLMRGARFDKPIPRNRTTQIKIEVEYPLPGWEIFGWVERQHEGLF